MLSAGGTVVFIHVVTLSHTNLVIHSHTCIHTHTHTHTRTCNIYSTGINPPPEVNAVPFSSVADIFNTGDIILLSGATNSGAIIKLFTGAEFSHVGIVSLQE